MTQLLFFTLYLLGVEYSKEEFKSIVPEAVPLILKTVFSNTPLSNVKMSLDYLKDDYNNDLTKEESMIEKYNLKSDNVTHLSKVEFRFF